MTANNPYDALRSQMAAEFVRMRDDLKKQQEGVPPYNSKKLSAEEEARTLAEPWRLFPGEDSMLQPGLGHLTAPEAYSKAKLQMGPVEFTKWAWPDKKG